MSEEPPGVQHRQDLRQGSNSRTCQTVTRGGGEACQEHSETRALSKFSQVNFVVGLCILGSGPPFSHLPKVKHLRTRICLEPISY